MSDIFEDDIIDDTYDLTYIEITRDHNVFQQFSHVAYNIYTGEIVMAYNGTAFIFIDGLTKEHREQLKDKLLRHIRHI